MRFLARSASIGCALLMLAVPRWSHPQALSPRALEQIQSYTVEKLSRTPAEQKLDSTMLYAIRALGGQPPVGGISEPIPFVESFISENVAGDGTILVTIQGDVDAALLDALAAAGAAQIRPFPRFGQVTAALPVARLLDIAARDDVRFVRPAEEGTTNRYVPSASEPGAPPTGAVRVAALGTSEGVHAHGADLAIATGIDGTGVKICMLSSGVNSLALLQAAGQLPAVDVVAGQAGSGDEGTAMLQVVHDMAPGAALGFATANGGQANFANNILLLRGAPHNCDIIVDDFSYPLESAFQDGAIAQAVNTVTAAGALYFSAAGNYGNLTHANAGVWEGDFVSGGPTSFPLEIGTLHSFGPTTYNVLTARGSALALEWSDALGASSNDYDLFVLDPTGTNIVAASTISQTGTQDPNEFISCNAIRCPIGGRVVVVLFSGTTRALRVDPKRGKLSINTAGATFGHNAAASAITVAATDVANAGTGLFTGGPANPVEPYSSDGPRKIFYNPDGTAITPGNVLFATNGGTTLAKVDVTAADGVSTYVLSFDPFFGTSASVPGAAAIAGLIKSANPTATNAQIKSALLSSALDIEAPGTDRDSGAGIVMAPAAVRAVLATLVVGKSFAPSAILTGATSELTITVQNTNAIPIGGVAFTDTYPANVVNAGSPSAHITGAGCTGSLAASAGGGSLALASGIVPAGTTCSYKVLVTSNVANTYVNGGGAITTPIGLNSAAASASLVVGLAPSITATKSFAPTSITIGAPAVLTIVLANPNPFPVTGVAIVDGYPPGMLNTTDAAPRSSCGGTVTGADLGNSVALTGGVIPANGNCTITVNVTANAAARFVNTTGALTSANGGLGAPATATLVVTSNAQQIPILSHLAFVMLVALVALVGGIHVRTRRCARGELPAGYTCK